MKFLGIIEQFYKYYLSKPMLALLVFAVIGLISAYNAKGFYYDASADTLVAENDPDLLYYRQVSEHFGGAGFLFLTYTPKNVPLISKETIGKLDALVKKIRAINGVSGVSSILDAPLLQSPPIPMADLATKSIFLQSPNVDLTAAEKELKTSPLFKDLLISADGKTTAIRIVLAEDIKLNRLMKKRNHLRLISNPTAVEESELKIVGANYRAAYAENTQNLEILLTKLRIIRTSIEGDVTSYLGGVPMIASDMMSYVRSDIIIFGSGSLLLMMIMLFMFFKSIRWVVIPVISTSFVLLITIGLLGFLHKPVTVISSNFISLLIILSISIAVHLITRYRTFLRENPKLSHTEVVFETMKDKVAPCFYTTLTTMAGFASLYASSIIPVMDFGWLMCVGIGISLITFYLVFPIILVLMPRERLPTTEIEKENSTPLVGVAYRLAAHRTNLVLLVTVILMGFTALGISKISLDNRFVDYFKENTEINKGLTFIDKNLGGTVPMDIIINFPPYVDEGSFEEDDFFTGEEEDVFPERYWFTADKIELIRKIEDFLDTRPEIGKIISLATLESIAQNFNGGRTLTSVEIVAILSMLPKSIKDEFLNPYAVPSAGLMKISTRIHETGPLFSRDKLIKDIYAFAESVPELKGNVKVTGMNVLFNGMLRELLASQTSTLLYVVLATFIMFLILLRSPIMAVIGVLPNVFSAFLILSFMGFVGIPLDMMTITIAAIVIGIGVDDAIHYLHYFRERFNVHGNVDQAIRESHREIGRALYVTSLTVIIGFSVLTTSNFVPTIYFGILAATAMILALMANLVLLPTLLLKFYTFKAKMVA